MFKPDTRILVIDDMSTMRKIVVKSLKEMGFVDIREAADGKLGWDVIDKTLPAVDLVISDWNMPNCTGLELLRKVRGDARFVKLPFVLLTAEAEAAQVAEAIKSGANNYIIKPFTPDSLKEKLEQTHKRLGG
jgi:two-component system chemotaxis response regulator CheY